MREVLYNNVAQDSMSCYESCERYEFFLRKSVVDAAKTRKLSQQIHSLQQDS